MDLAGQTHTQTLVTNFIYEGGATLRMSSHSIGEVTLTSEDKQKTLSELLGYGASISKPKISQKERRNL